MRQRGRFGEEAQPPPSSPPAVYTYRDKLREWVSSDCRNKDCIDGNVAVSDANYSTLYRCPVCARSTVAVREWDGPVEYWTDEEMAARLKDRKDVYFDREYRYKRGLEVMALLKEIAGGTPKPPKEDGWGTEAVPF